MRLLITGGTGLLGSDLMKQLPDSYEGIGWARRPPASADPRLRLESVDITDEQAVQEGLRRLKPDFVVHTAALSDVDACETDPGKAFAVNAKATQHLARCCHEIGASLIAVSTDYVFDGGSARPYRETDPPHPINQYGQTKLAGERAVLSWASNVLVIRVSGLFGSSRPNFVLGVARSLRSGKPVQVVTNQAHSPTYTVDLSAGIIRLVEKWQKEAGTFFARLGSGRLLHMANAGCASRLEVARRIAEQLKAPESLIEPTTWKKLGRPAQRPANSSLDTGCLREVLGIPLRSWKEALENFLRTAVL